MIIVQCSKCSREIRADNQYAGRIARCPDCNQRVAIPTLETDGSAPTTPQTPAPPAVARQRVPLQARPNRRAGRSGSTGILWEVKRIRIFHAGLVGLLAGVPLGLVFILLNFIFLHKAGLQITASGAMVMIWKLPIMFFKIILVWSVVSGIVVLLFATIYNFVASLVGGCKVQLQHSA